MFSFSDDTSSKLSVGPATLKLLRVSDKNRDGSPLMSKNGNHKILLTYEARDSYGAEGRLYENLPLISTMAWKAKQIAKAFDVPEAISDSGFNTDLLLQLAKRARCTLYLQQSEGYKDRVIIEEYLPYEVSDDADNQNHYDAIKTVVIYDDDDSDIPF